MSLIQKERVKETSVTQGTGNVTLAGAATGFRSFGSVMADNDTCLYCIAVQGGSDWEIGLGTFVSATPALARTAVLDGTNGTSRVNFGAGTKDVFMTLFTYANILQNLGADRPPPADGVALYTRPYAGRHVPRFIGPSGLDSAVQPAPFANCLIMWLPETISPVPPPPPPPPREPYRGGEYIPKRQEVLLNDGRILTAQEIQITEAHGRLAIISASRSAAGGQSTKAEGFIYNRQEEEIIFLSLLL